MNNLVLLSLCNEKKLIKSKPVAFLLGLHLIYSGNHKSIKHEWERSSYPRTFYLHFMVRKYILFEETYQAFTGSVIINNKSQIATLIWHQFNIFSPQLMFVLKISSLTKSCVIINGKSLPKNVSRTSEEKLIVDQIIKLVNT